MDSLKIGEGMLLDTRTRILLRVKDGRKVKLGVSPCECLQALVNAKEETLSQEILLDVGWRKVGIEVTSSSLRVAINQLRRAFLSLQTDKDILIVTVPRAGYRLIINANRDIGHKIINISAETNATDAVHVAPIVIQKHAKDEVINDERKFNLKYLLLAAPLLFSIAGIFASLMLGKKIEESAIPVTYELYKYPVKNKHPNANIYVDSKTEMSPSVVEMVLNLWESQVTNAAGYSDLYLNINANKTFTGLFACKNPIGEKNSDCNSYVFSTF